MRTTTNNPNPRGDLIGELTGCSVEKGRELELRAAQESINYI